MKFPVKSIAFLESSVIFIPSFNNQQFTQMETQIDVLSPETIKETLNGLNKEKRILLHYISPNADIFDPQPWGPVHFNGFGKLKSGEKTVKAWWTLLGERCTSYMEFSRIVKIEIL